MRFLQTLIAHPLPSVDEVVEQQVQEALAANQQSKLTELELSQRAIKPQEELLAEVTVKLTKGNDCNMSIVWKNVPDKSNAKAVARMLYQLNEGGMKGLMAEIIQQTAQGDYRMTKSGQNIMEEWEKMYNADASKACVPATKVFPNG